MHKGWLAGAIAAGIIAGAGLWLGVSGSGDSVVAGVAEASGPAASGPLDGRSYVGSLGLVGGRKDVKDTFVFANGTFASAECETLCKYPASPYFLRKTAEGSEFVSISKCPYKDATIIWRGTIKGDTLSGVSTWRLKRWYWTVEKKFTYTGKLVGPQTPLASAQ